MNALLLVLVSWSLDSACAERVVSPGTPFLGRVGPEPVWIQVTGPLPEAARIVLLAVEAAVSVRGWNPDVGELAASKSGHYLEVVPPPSQGGVVRVALSADPPAWVLAVVGTDGSASAHLPPALVTRAERAAVAWEESRASNKLGAELAQIMTQAARGRAVFMAALLAHVGVEWAKGVQDSLPESFVAFQVHVANCEGALGRAREEGVAVRDGLQAAEALGAEDEAHAQLLQRAGMASKRRGDFALAIRQFERVIAMRKARGGDEYPLLYKDLAQVGIAQKESGQSEAAHVTLLSAIKLAHRIVGPDADDSLQLQLHIADVEYAINQVESALRRLQSVLEKREMTKGPRSPEVATVLSYRLRAQADVSMSTEALATAERAIDLWTELAGPRSLEVAIARYSKGRSLTGLRRYAEARPELEAGLALLLSVLGPRHEFSLSARVTLGNLLVLQGEIEKGREVLDLVLREPVGDDPTRIRNHSGVLSGLAYAAFLEGKFDESERRLREWIALCEAKISLRSSSLVLALSNLAYLLEAQGRPGDAFMAHQRAFDQVRGFLVRFLSLLPESSRLEFVAAERGHLSRLLHLGFSHEEPAAAAQLHARVADWKNRVARGLWAQRDWLAKNRSADLARQLAEITSTIAEQEGARSSGDATTLRSLREMRSRLEQALFLRTPEMPVQRILGSEEIQSRLQAGEALCDFVITKSPITGQSATYGAEAESRVFVFILRSEGPVTALDLGSAREIEEAVAAHVMATSRRRNKPTQDPTVWSKAVVERLWRPLEPHLRDARRVLVCPDGFLANLPFGTLPGASPGRFLVEDYQWVYLQSIHDLWLERSSELGPAVLVGGLDYGAPADQGQARWKPLPESEREIDALQTLGVELAREVVVLKGGAARESALRERIKDASHVHVATHGHLRGDRSRALRQAVEQSTLEAQNYRADVTRAPLELALSDAGLVLSGANEASTGPDDGFLSADEAAWLELRNCDLLVLSACEAGALVPEVATELLGLRRAFRLAGARGTVAALWSVDDDATRRLMMSFYRRLWEEGRSPADALHGAQLEMLEANRQAAGDGLPAHWGAFLYEGIPR